MNRRKAAPREPELPGETLRGGDLSAGTAIIPLPALNLPPAVLGRLAGASVHSCQDWQRLSRTERRAIWGVTNAWVRVIDRLVATALGRVRS